MPKTKEPIDAVQLSWEVQLSPLKSNITQRQSHAARSYVFFFFFLFSLSLPRSLIIKSQGFGVYSFSSSLSTSSFKAISLGNKRITCINSGL